MANLSVSKITLANSYHEHSPSQVIWYNPKLLSESNSFVFKAIEYVGVGVNISSLTTLTSDFSPASLIIVVIKLPPLALQGILP